MRRNSLDDLIDGLDLNVSPAKRRGQSPAAAAAAVGPPSRASNDILLSSGFVMMGEIVRPAAHTEIVYDQVPVEDLVSGGVSQVRRASPGHKIPRPFESNRHAPLPARAHVPPSQHQQQHQQQQQQQQRRTEPWQPGLDALSWDVPARPMAEPQHRNSARQPSQSSRHAAASAAEAEGAVSTPSLANLGGEPARTGRAAGVLNPSEEAFLDRLLEDDM
jgi:hypothetical protein